MFAQLIDTETLEKMKRWDELKRWERREIGQELRRLGLCYHEIACLIPVSKGTLSGWCRDLELTPAQSQLLEARQRSLSALGRIGKKRRYVARERNAAIRRDARAEARTLAADSHRVAGTMAYWAEGSKTHKCCWILEFRPSTGPPVPDLGFALPRSHPRQVPHPTSPPRRTG